MTLKARIIEDMKTAMRAKDAARLSTIRMLLAAIKQREVDERIELTDADVLAIIDKMVKQRRDSIAQFEAGKREDLAANERAEIDVLAAYMPAQAPTPRSMRDRRRDRGAGRLRDRRHGQGDGGPEAQARRPRRHGRGIGADQGQAGGLVATTADARLSARRRIPPVHPFAWRSGAYNAEVPCRCHVPGRPRPRVGRGGHVSPAAASSP